MVELETGNKVGIHDGFWFYTIGQRQGLGLSGGPWYVAKKDTDRNIVYISRNYYSAEKKRNTFEVDSCNWFARPEKTDLKVKLRHGPHTHACVIEKHENGVRVQLEDRDQGIAAGQFAVFYDNDLCLGGGVISRSIST